MGIWRNQCHFTEMPLLFSFHSWVPNGKVSQNKVLNYIGEVHGQRSPHPQTLKKLISRVGAGEHLINNRAHSLPVMDTNSQEDIYHLAHGPEGPGTTLRNQIAHQRAIEAMNQILTTNQPEHLIHVSCTGYTSPSAAQLFALDHQWHTTQVTHAYHMGCYASVPAIRIAHSGQTATIAHTESCTLHLAPHVSTPEQLVIESLFGDGYIAYQFAQSPELIPSGVTMGLKILAIQEQLIPGSAEAMAWALGTHGMTMRLSREVPDLIASRLQPYLKALASNASVRLEELISKGAWAIHPGGPKIIDNIQSLLGLQEWQVAHSREVLLNHGNMSSATLPHVWEKVINDPSLPAGTPVVSLAFGPGLTIAGMVLKKWAR